MNVEGCIYIADLQAHLAKCCWSCTLPMGWAVPVVGNLLEPFVREYNGSGDTFGLQVLDWHKEISFLSHPSWQRGCFSERFHRIQIEQDNLMEGSLILVLQLTARITLGKMKVWCYKIFPLDIHRKGRLNIWHTTCTCLSKIMATRKTIHGQQVLIGGCHGLKEVIY